MRDARYLRIYVLTVNCINVRNTDLNLQLFETNFQHRVLLSGCWSRCWHDAGHVDDMLLVMLVKCAAGHVGDISCSCMSAAQLTLPAAELTVPAAQLTVPAAQLTVPAAQLTVPAVQDSSGMHSWQCRLYRTSPACTADSAGCTADGAGMHIWVLAVQLAMPAAQLTLPAAQLTVPAAQLIVSAAQLIVSAAQLIVSAAQLTVPAAQLTVPAAQLTVPAKYWHGAVIAGPSIRVGLDSAVLSSNKLFAWTNIPNVW